MHGICGFAHLPCDDGETGVLSQVMVDIVFVRNWLWFCGGVFDMIMVWHTSGVRKSIFLEALNFVFEIAHWWPRVWFVWGFGECPSYVRDCREGYIWSCYYYQLWGCFFRLFGLPLMLSLYNTQIVNFLLGVFHAAGKSILLFPIIKRGRNSGVIGAALFEDCWYGVTMRGVFFFGVACSDSRSSRYKDRKASSMWCAGCYMGFFRRSYLGPMVSCMQLSCFWSRTAWIC